VWIRTTVVSELLMQDGSRHRNTPSHGHSISFEG